MNFSRLFDLIRSRPAVLVALALLLMVWRQRFAPAVPALRRCSIPTARRA